MRRGGRVLSAFIGAGIVVTLAADVTVLLVRAGDGGKAGNLVSVDRGAAPQAPPSRR